MIAAMPNRKPGLYRASVRQKKKARIAIIKLP